MADLSISLLDAKRYDIQSIRRSNEALDFGRIGKAEGANALRTHGAACYEAQSVHVTASDHQAYCRAGGSGTGVLKEEGQVPRTYFQ